MKILISRASRRDVVNKKIQLERVYPKYEELEEWQSWDQPMYSADIKSLEELNILANITQGGIVYSRIQGFEKLLFPDFEYQAIIYDDWIE